MRSHECAPGERSYRIACCPPRSACSAADSPGRGARAAVTWRGYMRGGVSVETCRAVRGAGGGGGWVGGVVAGDSAASRSLYRRRTALH